MTDPGIAVHRLLRGAGAVIGIGPFIVRLRSPLHSVARCVALHYHAQILPADTPFSDFHVLVTRAFGLRGYWRPQARFFIDGASPFKPLPLSQAYPLFEWGLNWCIAQHAHHFLMIHAAVVERGGRALLLPGVPGSGKSTLCATLVLRGWRLLSDEFALISLEDGQLAALPRPMSLKNESIALIRDRFPDAVLGPEARDTAKGTISHLQVPRDSVIRAHERALPAQIVFPHYQADGADVLAPLSKAQSLLKLADSSFNYSVLGARGFAATTRLADACDCHTLEFSGLDEAIRILDALHPTAP